MRHTEEIFPMENTAEQLKGSRRIRRLGVTAVVLGAGILIGAEATQQLLSSPLFEMLGTGTFLAGVAVTFSETSMVNQLSQAIETRQHAEAEV